MKQELADSADISTSSESGRVQASAEAASAIGRSASRDGFWEWLTRARALRTARTGSHAAQMRTRELMRRARAAAELGDRVLDAFEPLRAGPAKHLALDLFRQSLFWTLSAIEAESGRNDPADVIWDRCKSIEGLKFPSEPQLRVEVEGVLSNQDFRSIAELAEAHVERVAEGLRDLAHSALQMVDPTDAAVRRLSFQRFVRVSGLTLLLSLLLGGMAVGFEYLTRKPNLALGKPWRASSTWAECRPELERCGHVKTKIFFHTLEEVNPWVEFDLLAPTQISEVYVKNRSDSVPDRAVPLILEVSDDAQAWREMATQKETFRTWTASFPPLTTRYVRLRVNRRTQFHLDRVEIRP